MSYKHVHTLTRIKEFDFTQKLEIYLFHDKEFPVGIKLLKYNSTCLGSKTFSKEKN